MSEPPIIDAATLSNLRSLETDGESNAFLRELIGLFAKDIPARLAELEAALKTSDSAVAMRAAHSIKGCSANLGALALRLSAERLEDHLRRVPGGEHGLLVAAVRAEFGRARAELERLVGQSPG